MSKITIRSLLNIDSTALQQEAASLGLTFTEGPNQGITKIFFIAPDLTPGQKTILLALIDKIGTGSITP